MNNLVDDPRRLKLDTSLQDIKILTFEDARQAVLNKSEITLQDVQLLINLQKWQKEGSWAIVDLGKVSTCGHPYECVVNGECGWCKDVAKVRAELQLVREVFAGAIR